MRAHNRVRAMRYRRVIYRSTTLRLASQSWPFGGAWEHETLRLLVQARWRPAADVAETAGSIEVTVDLAGVDEDDFEVQLFDNGLVVEGRRQLPSCGEDSVYHAAAWGASDAVMGGNRLLVFVAQREPAPDAAVTPENVHRVGTAGAIHQMARMPDGSVRVMVQGIERVRLLDFVAKDPYLVARIQGAPEHVAAGPEVEGLRRAVVDLFRRLVQLSSELPDELAGMAESFTDPRQVVYFVASLVRMDTAARQVLLETDSVADKLRRLVDVVQSELSVREIGRKIASATEQRLAKKQREFIPREQAKTIQKELGEDGDDDSEVTELRRRIEEAGLPDEARREAERELKRLAGMQPGSPERGMVLAYLEWMASLPWSKTDGGTIDIRRAREVLDEDHFDLEKIKDRILEYLAVRKLRQERGAGAEPPKG